MNNLDFFTLIIGGNTSVKFKMKLEISKEVSKCIWDLYNYFTMLEPCKEKRRKKKKTILILKNNKK